MEKKNILIVDDEAALGESFSNIFHHHFPGSRVFAPLPVEAGLCIENTKIDVAFIDIVMPEIKGFELLKILKKRQPECRAFIISGYGDHATRREALRLGAEKFIQKPFDPDLVVRDLKL